MKKLKSLALTFLIFGLFLSGCSSSDFGRQMIFREMIGLRHHCASVTELDDGSLIAVWYYGNTYHGEGDRGGAILASANEGFGWCEPFVIYDTPWMAEGNPVIHYDSYNKQLYLFTGVMHSEENNWSRLTTHMFVADVQTISDIKYGSFLPIDFVERHEYKSEGWDKGDTFYGIVLRNKPVVFDGRMWLAFNLHRQVKDSSTESDLEEYTKREAYQTVGVMSMDLESKQWSKITYIEGSENAAQPALFMYADELNLFCRNTSMDSNKVWASRLSKGWSNLKQINVVNENNALDLVTLPNGNLLMVRNTDRSRDKLVLEYMKRDGRLQWESVVTLEDKPDSEFSYPCMIVSRDGKRVYIVYTYQRRTIAFREIGVDNASWLNPWLNVTDECQ